MKRIIKNGFFISLIIFPVFLFAQRVHPDGSTHYSNGTTYWPRANEGKQGVVTAGSDTWVDCAEFPETCRELIRKADDLEPKEPGEQNPGSGDDQENPGTGGKDNPDTGGKDNGSGNDGGSKDSQSLMTSSMRKAIAEHSSYLRKRRGLWHRNPNGKWVYVADASTHTAKLLGQIKRKKRG
jgi:hypothetical protein